MATSLAALSVGPPDNTYTWYLHSAGVSLATGFAVALGDGSETPLWLDADGIGVRSAGGFVSHLQSEATAARTITLGDGGGKLLPALMASLAADQANATVTAAAATGMSLALEASGLYEFEAILLFKSASTATAPRFRLLGPTAQTTWVNYRAETPHATAALTNPGSSQSQEYAAWAGDFLPTSGPPAADTVYAYRVRGLCKISGTAPASAVSVEFWSETAASAVTLVAGSQLAFRKLN